MRHKTQSLIFLVILALIRQPVFAESLVSQKPASLTGMLLVASETIRDPRFRHAVLLITRHTEEGALAVLINHPTRILLSRALPDLLELQDSPDRLFIGGPMTGSPYMMLFNSGNRIPDKSAVQIFGNVYFTMNANLIPGILNQTDGALRVYSGFASWGPGQLEGELRKEVWSLTKADVLTVFSDTPSRVWSDLTRARQAQKWVTYQPNLHFRLMSSAI